MRALFQSLSRISIANATRASFRPPLIAASHTPFSTSGGGNDDNSKDLDWAAHDGANTGPSGSDSLGWEAPSSSWSTGLTKEHFDGEIVGKMMPRSKPDHDSDQGPLDVRWTDKEMKNLFSLAPGLLGRMGEQGKDYADEELLVGIKEPGARSCPLMEWEKDEMYEKHKKDPELYSVENLAKEYKIMRQRVHAILWLRELEEEEVEKAGGREVGADIVDLYINLFPEFFAFHDREFHVATLPYKPDFKVMPEGWDGTTRDPDEVHYEISKKEDQMLYEDFVQRMNFNKMKMKNMVKCHPHSRRRASDGWSITVEKLGPKDKRGNGGGRKFISEADGSTRPLNEFEKMFVKRETPRRRRKLPIGAGNTSCAGNSSSTTKIKDTTNWEKQLEKTKV